MFPHMVEPALIPTTLTSKLQSIKTVKELSALLNYNYQKELSFALYRMSNANKYKVFIINKKNGGERIISAPNGFILEIQRRLLPFLEEIYSPPPYVHGYVKGRSIATNAKKHVGKRYVVNIDLKDFFPSINFNRISRILQSSKYNLTKEIATAIAQISCFDGKLPVGAATSGILSNIVCSPLDKRLFALAKQYRLTYSRYADDITFSCTNPINLRKAFGISLDGAYIERSIEALSPEFKKIFEDSWFEINEKKIWITTKYARQTVTGLVVNKKINVKRTYFRNLKATVSSIENHGYENAQKFYQEKYKNGEKSLKKSLLGKLSFLGHSLNYNSKYTRIANRVQKIFPHEKIKIPYNDKFKSIYVLTAMPSEYQGTATHIGKGLFLTASHVVDKNDYAINLICPGHFEDKILADIIFRDDKNDLAILKCKNNIEYRPSIEISSKRPSLHENVDIIGFPNYASGNTHTSINTNITGERILFEGKKYDVDKALYKGISGGPVLNDTGQIIGIVYSGPQYGNHEAPLSVAFSDVRGLPKEILEI